MISLNERVKKMNLLDEKLSQSALVFLMLIFIKKFPQFGNMDLIWSIPLCAITAIRSLVIYWAKPNEKTSKLERRIQRFTFLDLVIAHFAFFFGFYVFIRIIPILKEISFAWCLVIFIVLAIKPFYVFWIKK